MKSHRFVFSSGLRLFLNAVLLGAVATLTGCALWPFNASSHSERALPPPTADMRPARAVADPAASASASPAPEAAMPSETESLWVPMPMAPSAPPLSASEHIETLSAPVPTGAAKASAAGPSASTSTSLDLMPGRYAVQIGVFLVPSNAETIRARIQERLANERTLKPSDKEVRSLKKGQRTYVVVGDVPDRNAAEFLAARLRLLLDQDVVVFKR